MDIQDGHIYGGLLNVVIPHVSQHLGEQLETLVLSCSPGKIELERSLEENRGDNRGWLLEVHAKLCPTLRKDVISQHISTCMPAFQPHLLLVMRRFHCKLTTAHTVWPCVTYNV